MKQEFETRSKTEVFYTFYSQVKKKIAIPAGVLG